MPSSKAPSTIGIGPGRLPSSVAASVQSPSTLLVDESDSAVLGVSSSMTPSRLATHQTLLVNTTGGIVIISLTNNPNVIHRAGDTITIIDLVGNAHVNEIRIAATPTSSINNLSGTWGSIADRFGTLTLVFSGNNAWGVVSKSGPVDLSTTATLTILRRNPLTRVFVLTANAAWVSGTSAINLPSSPSKGDVVSIIDADGSANKQIIVSGNGSAIDTDLSQFVMTGDNATLTLCFNTFSSGTLGWTILNKPTHYVLTTGDDMTLTRVSSRMRLAVQTNLGSWIASDIITLPASASTYVGDTITIFDAGNTAETKPIVINPNGLTINGLATYTLSRNNGVVTLFRTTAGWVTEHSSDLVPYELIVNNTLTLTRRSAVMRILVQTAAGSWSGDSITLPAAPVPGDVITIVDVDGQASVSLTKDIDVLGNGNNISGIASYVINSSFGFITMVFASAGGWFITAKGEPNYIQVVGVNTTLARAAQVMMVQVQSAPGMTTLTLPAAPVRGDIITVVDVGNLVAANNYSIAGNGKNINGSPSLLITTNRKSVTMTFNGDWYIIGAGP